jgi:hypothetical protein
MILKEEEMLLLLMLFKHNFKERILSLLLKTKDLFLMPMLLIEVLILKDQNKTVD